MPTQAPEGGVPASPRPAGDGGGKRKNICDTQHDAELLAGADTDSVAGGGDIIVTERYDTASLLRFVSTL